MAQDGDGSQLGDDLPTFKTSADIAGFLALKHANGMPLKQVLDLHTLILARIARDYVKIWGLNPETGEPADVGSEAWKIDNWLQSGAQYILWYLIDDDEWYDWDE